MDVNEATPRDRTGQRGAMPQQFIIGNDETESECQWNPDHS